MIALLRSMVSSPAAAAQTLKTRSESATARTAQEADALGSLGLDPLRTALGRL